MRTWDRPKQRLEAARSRLLVPKRAERHPWRWLGLGALSSASGAGLMFAFDPQAGRRRRALARERGAATARRAFRRMAHWTTRTRADALGRVARLRHRYSARRPAANDALLADRVRSQLPRDFDLHRHPLNVSTENGVVVLRGVVDRADQEQQLIESVRRVAGVRRVESYLHLPGTPPPNKLPIIDGARPPDLDNARQGGRARPRPAKA
jgi:hypothetical protein